MNFGNPTVAAEMFGVSKYTVIRRLKSGEWPGQRSRTGRWLANLQAIQDMLSGLSSKYKKR